MTNSSRRLRRFFSPQALPAEGGRVALSAQETRHLRQILRLKPGDRCLLINGRGREATARIQDISGAGAQLEIESLKILPADDGRLYLRTFQALAKGGKVDFLIEKAQELGVQAFWPVITERSDFSMTEEKNLKVWERWQKKALEAAKQSGSPYLTEIAPCRPLAEAVEAVSEAETLVCFHPSPEAVPFGDWVPELLKACHAGRRPRLNLFFGPEGGFSARDLEILRKKKASSTDAPIMISLGENILRLETAYLGVVSALRFLIA